MKLHTARHRRVARNYGQYSTTRRTHRYPEIVNEDVVFDRALRQANLTPGRDRAAFQGLHMYGHLTTTSSSRAARDSAQVHAVHAVGNVVHPNGDYSPVIRTDAGGGEGSQAVPRTRCLTNLTICAFAPVALLER